VRFFVLERPRRRKTNTNRSLDVMLILSHLDTWVFLFFTENLGILVGILWRPDLKVNWDAGKGNYYPMEID
jgi:hypothetical protein